jgi:sugar (pentulose or hexulose) kinase
VTLAGEPFVPLPKNADVYDQAYARYRSLYDALEGGFT